LLPDGLAIPEAHGAAPATGQKGVEQLLVGALYDLADCGYHTFHSSSLQVIHTKRLSEFLGIERWPGRVPVQVHYAAEDPWVEAEGVEALGEAVREAGATFEEHVYPGLGHLFADPDLPEYDRASSDAMWERVLAFLDRVDARGSEVESEAS